LKQIWKLASFSFQQKFKVRSQVLVTQPVILATWEAEIGRIEVLDQSSQIVPETLSPK
jgi:hypothetical protein